MKSDGTASALLLLVIACLLALAACQDRTVEPTAGAPETKHVTRPPAGSAGAAAGTAEGKKMTEKDPLKRAEFAETTLAARVKAALSADPALAAVAVDVAASGNSVTLMGTADNARNRDKAERIALGVQGVNSVENQLRIARNS
jgi:hyperosmotically inducible periplasmic protein